MEFLEEEKKNVTSFLFPRPLLLPSLTPPTTTTTTTPTTNFILLTINYFTVLSRTGYIFERRLIEEHIQRLGTCPVTKEALADNDLTEIRVNRIAKPRTATATSIPAMLQTFQNEWDALMMETFELRKQLDQARMELATALYKQDAAERTIARLIRERDHAREQAKHTPQHAELGEASSMEIQGGGLNAAQEELLDKTAGTLIAKRRERVVEKGTAAEKDVQHLKERASVGTQTKSPCLCVAVDFGTAAVGGQDGSLALVDWTSGAIQGGIKGGASKSAIHDVQWVSGLSANRMVLTASADHSVKLWSVSASHSVTLSHDHTAQHTDAVTSVSTHPSGRFFASASRDRTWALVDLQQSTTVYSVETQDPLHAIRFHPDGLLLATAGEDAQHALRIWDVKSKEDAVALTSHGARISAISFSENGYLLATASLDSSVKIWDLRNLDEPLVATEAFGGGAIHAVQFDFSGQYLSCGGVSTLSCFSVNQETGALRHLSRLGGHQGTVNGVAWTKDARSLISVGSDSLCKIWS